MCLALRWQTLASPENAAAVGGGICKLVNVLVRVRETVGALRRRGLACSRSRTIHVHVLVVEHVSVGG